MASNMTVRGSWMPAGMDLNRKEQEPRCFAFGAVQSSAVLCRLRVTAVARSSCSLRVLSAHYRQLHLVNVIFGVTLSERIDSDLKTAMREKNATKLGVLRMVKAALTNATIEKSGAQGQLNDADATQVIRKQVKQRQDSIESFEKGGRAELAAKEKEELSILQSYLPQAMSADEISKIVRETIAEVGATSKAQMGAVMKALQAKIAGRADGKTLSAEVQKQLSG
jgi:uncharacterized protein YqeY